VFFIFICSQGLKIRGLHWHQDPAHRRYTFLLLLQKEQLQAKDESAAANGMH
jgi:hypothetical protein